MADTTPPEPPDAPEPSDAPEPPDAPESEPPDAPESEPPDEAPASEPLDERSRRLLDFERRWWRQPGAKEQAIRDAFGLSPTRYYQLLNALLDEPAALAHDPVLVQRLRRLRASRRRNRHGR